MLSHYQEKCRLTQDNLEQESAGMGLTQGEHLKIIKEIIGQKGAAIVSHYCFDLPSGAQGSIVVCHDLHRGAISFGASTRWGEWDDLLEILTLDDTGEKFNFDGKPVYEGDDGACALGNF
jgi:hypothetical protein